MKGTLVQSSKANDIKRTGRGTTNSMTINSESGASLPLVFYFALYSRRTDRQTDREWRGGDLSGACKFVPLLGCAAPTPLNFRLRRQSRLLGPDF